MYKKSQPSTEPRLFSNVLSQVSPKKSKKLEDPKAWHNVFYHQITQQIDESPYSVLYSEEMGRPNSPIRILLSMMILKEGQGWTDEQLYEECMFNLKIMLALGLQNIDEDIPSASTYYEFKNRVERYERQNQENLLEQSFRHITKGQVIKYKVSGKQIRMDSKLLQANIARCNRLQLILGVIKKFYRTLSEGSIKHIRKKYDKALLERISSQTPTNITYVLKEGEKKKMLKDLGFLTRKLVNLYNDTHSSYYETLCRMYQEQYEYEDKPTQPKDPNDIDTGSLQSAHDPEAAYRSKGSGSGKQQVSGYHANITETCNDDGLNLVTDVKVDSANVSECEFLQPALESTQQILDDETKAVWTDGGFDSYDNRDQLSEIDEFTWYLSKTKGSEYTYSMEQKQDGTIWITDKITSHTYQAVVCSSGKYRIPNCRSEKSKYRYFKPKQIHSYLALQKILPDEPVDKNKRANVEATIRQVFNTLNGIKTPYRGLFRNKAFVICRAFWTNFKRIHSKIEDLDPEIMYLESIFGPIRRFLNNCFHFRFWEQWRIVVFSGATGQLKFVTSKNLE
jgi:hypothetical protein